MSIQSLFAKVNTEIVKDADEAWSGIQNVWNADVEPIIKSTFMYIEQNGAADIILIAKRVVSAGLTTLLSGGNILEALPAIAGTVMDEAKSAGIQIEQGAALLVTSMVHSALTGNATAGASTGTETDSPSQNT